MSRIQHPSFTGALISLKGAEDPQTKMAALDGLAALDAQNAAASLVTALKDSNYEVRRKAVELLGKSRDERNLPVLVQALGDSDGYVAMAATDEIARFGVKALPFLERALGAESLENSRFHAYQTIGRIPSAEAFELLLKHLDEPSGQRRATVISALYQVDPIKAIPFMRRIQKSRDPADAVAQFHIDIIFKRDRVPRD